jgi:hypothetical protein
MRSPIRYPLVLAIVLAVLVLALAVGWQILVVGDSRSLAAGLTTLDWVLLVLGSPAPSRPDSRRSTGSCSCSAPSSSCS